MWNQVIIYPFTNALLKLYVMMGHNFVLAIILLTVAIRLLLIPLTAKQQKSQLKMQEMQPEIKRVQEKYKGEPERLQKELKKIGYNPASMLAGCLPMLVQFPILIGMYRSILHAIPSMPLQMMDLYQAVYRSAFPNFNAMIPVKRQMLWMDLTQPDRLYLPVLPDIGIPILPVFVYLTTVMQQKMMTPPVADPKDQSAQMQRSMMTMMPLMFAFFALQFASGLSIYFITANIAMIAQFFLINRERLEWTLLKMPAGLGIPFPTLKATPAATVGRASSSAAAEQDKKSSDDGEKMSRSKRKRLDRIRARKARGGAKRRGGR